MPTSDGLTRVTIWCAYASGVVTIFGIVFLIAFFTSFVGILGVLNDVAVVIQHILMIPIALWLHKILSPSRPGLSRVGLLTGLVGMLAVIVLQLLFMTGMLPYAQYIGLVSAGFMVVLGWFLIIRIWDNPRGLCLGVLFLQSWQGCISAIRSGRSLWRAACGHLLKIEKAEVFV